jgi:predicted transcriptional regulator of viral defense system
MKLVEIMISLRREPVFDLPLLEMVSGQNRNTLRVQLHRWIADGKVVSLRRGLYTLAEGLSEPKQGAVLANLMVNPSYLTGLWALSWHGLIPEAVYEYTSAVTSYKQQYENAFGRFSYRRLKADCFRGWREVEYANTRIRVATPEKAVLDHLYWTPGDAVQTMKVLRFQPDSVPGFSWDALMQCAEEWGRPKLMRFAKVAPEEFSSDWEEI